MKHLPQTAFRRMPWKNGGGETIEIAVHPEGAGFEDFLWRISSAHVAAPGPFSTFAGIDRTLSVLGSRRLELDIAGRGVVALDGTSPPYHFPGDIAVSGGLPDGPLDDFNVMTRRGRARHHVTRVMLDSARPVPVAGDHLLVFACGTGLIAMRSDLRCDLAKGDCLLAEAGAPVRLEPLGRGEAYLVDLWIDRR